MNWLMGMAKAEVGWSPRKVRGTADQLILSMGLKRGYETVDYPVWGFKNKGSISPAVVSGSNAPRKLLLSALSPAPL